MKPKPKPQPRQSHAKDFIAALKTENAKLHAKIVHLEVQDVTNKSRITALEEELGKYKNSFHSKTLNLPIRERIKRLRRASEPQTKSA